jgi:hypothetical protein
LVTLVESLISKPCFLKIFVGFLADLAVHAGQDLVEELDAGDLRAEARQTEPSSSPITPPPITTRCSGTFSSSSAPVESTTIFWSLSRRREAG